MTRYLDVQSWPRRDVFEFYRGFDKPYFNICVRMDVTALLSHLRERGQGNVSLAYHYFALRVANEIEQFRYRLRGDKVIVHDVIHGGTTVLLESGSFALAYFDYHEDYARFVAAARVAVDQARAVGLFKPKREHDARIHFTTVPWIAFTSFSHARNWGREDSVPKIAFGKFVNENGRWLLPFSVEVHHALVDGSDVGRYLMRLEEALGSPATYIA
ncbi:MAG: chloramphenicol O-acetyltransferase type [Acidobacteriota bacterium]|jgi:chloramphenicol O-acetyltransferase type A|nr:chloramphenicol O-acetyltransferase type [Acidobacteriota bacterium]